MSRSLVEQLRAQRTGRVEVGGAGSGKYLQVRRPLEATEMARFFRHPTPEMFLGQVVGWDGITQADLLGAAVGASDPAPYSPELAAEYLADRGDWLADVGTWLAEAIKAHIDKRAAEAKN